VADFVVKVGCNDLGRWAGVREAGWHTPPGRVLAVWLDGIVEFETSDGEMRYVSAGGFVLVEEGRPEVIGRRPRRRF
jgi:hypothetical protein